MKSGVKLWKMRSVMVRALSFSALALRHPRMRPPPGWTS